MGTQLETTKKHQTLVEVKKNLSDLIEKNAKALPKTFNETRFLQNCLTVLNDTDKIEECNPVSVARTMIKGAYLGLDFFNKECYAIPYKGELQFQTDYKGERKLSFMYAVKTIKEIYAKIVREGDDFEAVIHEGKQVINFRPVQFSDKPPVGCFAVVYYEDGSMAYDVMSIAEIEKTRKDYSKCPDSPAWKKSPEEMYKKTVLRRLLKTVDLEFENQQQQKAFIDASDADQEKLTAPIDVKVDNPFAEDIQTIEHKDDPEPNVSETRPEPNPEPEPELEESPKCFACSTKVTEKVKEYSERKYGKCLCIQCQKFQDTP